jgi:hypothetical protein
VRRFLAHFHFHSSSLSTANDLASLVTSFNEINEEGEGEEIGMDNICLEMVHQNKIDIIS